MDDGHYQNVTILKAQWDDILWEVKLPRKWEIQKKNSELPQTVVLSSFFVRSSLQVHRVSPWRGRLSRTRPVSPGRRNRKREMDDTATEAQVCFVGEDGLRRCNFIFRNGEPLYTKSGKWWTFPAFPWELIRRARKTKTALAEQERFSAEDEA